MLVLNMERNAIVEITSILLFPNLALNVMCPVKEIVHRCVVGLVEYKYTRIQVHLRIDFWKIGSKHVNIGLDLSC